MSVEILPVEGLPEVRPGDDLVELLEGPLRSLGARDGDAIAVTQKIVSKSEGRLVPSDERARWIERESAAIVAERGDLLIARTRHGFVCANAGIDASNVPPGVLSLLPEDPDASAERLRTGLRASLGLSRLGVVVTDTFGRPWREGVVDVAIGCAGLAPLADLRGTRDDRGRALETTVVAHADAVSAASGLVMGKAARVPAALVRGVELSPGGAPPGPARALVRSGADDLFRESPMRSVSAAEPASRFDAGTLDLSAVEEAVRAAARESDGIAIVTATSPAAVRRLERARPETPGVPASAAIVVCVPADRSSEPSVVLAAGAALGRLTVALRAAGVGWRHAPAVGVAADRVSDALDLRAALRSVSVLMLGPVVAIRTTPATVGAHRRR